MGKSTGCYPRVTVDTAGSGVVSHAGAVLLIETIRTLGLDRALSAALAPWRRPLAVHDPGKVLLDLAVAIAVGGDCLADIAVLRGEPGVFGQVASDPTVSRVIDALAATRPRVLAAIDRSARTARALVWRRAGTDGPGPRDRRRASAGHRRGRHPGDRALGEGTRRADVQTRLRVPPAAGVRRPRPDGTGEPRGDAAAAGQRRHRTPPPTTSR